jgi:hypothetical protein
MDRGGYDDIRPIWPYREPPGMGRAELASAYRQEAARTAMGPPSHKPSRLQQPRLSQDCANKYTAFYYVFAKRPAGLYKVMIAINGNNQPELTAWSGEHRV